MQYQQPQPAPPKPTLYAVETTDTIPNGPDFAFELWGEVFFTSRDAAERYADGEPVRVVNPNPVYHVGQKISWLTMMNYSITSVSGEITQIVGDWIL